MPDRCEQFEAHLDGFVTGSLAAPVQRALQAHVQECQRCAALLAVVRGNDTTDARVAGAETDVLEQVLQSTSGGTCGQAQGFLCDLVDAALPSAEDQLVRDHLQHCRSCSKLARALMLLREDLPRLRELRPDDGFASEVIAATSMAAPPVPGFLDRLAATWSGLLQRPRFAWEVAWLGTAVLLLLMGAPQSPLRGVPQNALAIVQTNPLSAWNAMQPPMERAWGWVRDDIEAGWNASGGKVIDAVTSKRTQWEGQHPQAHASWQSIQKRMPPLRQAVADGNLAQASYIVKELGDDIQNLWHGLRAAPSDSLGSPTPPDREEN